MESGTLEDQPPKASEVAEGKAIEAKEEISVEVEKDGEGKVEKSKKRERKTAEEVKESKEEPKEKKARKRRSLTVEPVTPVDRPVRDRKTVERFAVASPESAQASKALSIKKGPGTQLKDIPNVAFKLSKRKVDENLQFLHAILFGKKSKAYHVKKNISQFSGFVWDENKEKQRARVKEKIDRCFKGKLLDFCEVLDIPVSKTATKKEDVAAKLLEFLESPHATREVLLAEMGKSRKGKKRRRKSGVSKEITSGEAKRETKKSKKNIESVEDKKGQMTTSEAEKNSESENEGDSTDEGAPDDEDESDEKEEKTSHVESEPVEEEDKLNEPRKKNSRNKLEKKASTIKGMTLKPGKSVAKSPVKKGVSSNEVTDEDEVKEEIEHKESDHEELAMKGESGSEKGSPNEPLKKVSRGKAEPKISPVKKGSKRAPSKSKEFSKTDKGDKKKGQKSLSESAQDKRRGKKQIDKSGSKASSTKEEGKGKARRNAKKEPSKEKMYSVVTNILKEVDFNTATLSDILTQLGDYFKMDLMERKAEVKQIIEEAINNMTDEEDEEEAGNEDSKKESEEENNADGSD